MRIKFTTLDLLKIFVDSALHTVSLKTKVNISKFSIMQIVLVEHVIQALIQVFEVEKDNCSSCLHTNFDLIDVSAYLQNIVYHNTL